MSYAPEARQPHTGVADALIAAAKPTCRLITDTIQARASVIDREPNMRHWC